MSKEDLSNPCERVTVPITDNATLYASRFCIEQCGMLQEACEMALVATAMASGGSATRTWEQGDEIARVTTPTDQEVPQIVMECRGPRKKFIVVGEYMCRGSAKVDAIVRA